MNKSKDEHDVQRALGVAVKHAVEDTPLDEQDHEALLALALGDEVADFDAEEVQAAKRLREALEGQGAHPLAELAVGLKHAFEPGELGSLQNERLVQRALVHRSLSSFAMRRKARFGAMVMGATMAAAAAALVWFQTDEPLERGVRGDEAPVAKLLRSQSTVGLFDRSRPLPLRGGETARFARIANARGRQLRANRFAKWGVR